MEIFVIDTDWKRRALITFSLSGEDLAAVSIDPADLKDFLPTEEQIFLICDEANVHELLGKIAPCSTAFCYSPEFQLRNVVEALKSGAKDYFAWPDDFEPMVDQIRKSQEEVARQRDAIDQKPTPVRYSNEIDHPAHGRGEDGAGQPLYAQQVISRLRSSLSPRELEVLELASYGLSSKSIADRLGIRRKTVDAHRNNILNKSRCSNMTEAVRWGIMSRMI